MPGWLRAAPRRPVIAVALAVLAFGLVEAAHLAGALEPLALRRFDRELARLARAGSSPPPVVLVVIDEADIRRFGHPLPDRDLTRLLGRLLAAEPRAVGVDLYRDMPVPRGPSGAPLAATPAYQALGELVLSDPRVVMTMRLPDERGEGTPPPAFIEGDGQLGFSDLPLDRGGRVRRGLLYLWQDDAPRYSMALQLAARFLAAEGVSPAPAEDDPDLLALGPTVVTRFGGDDGPYVRADAGGYQFLLDFRHGPRPIERVRVGDVIDGRVPAEVLRDRIALIGTTAASVKDSFRTWLDASSGRGGTYGIEVHAHAADQLIRFGRGESSPLRSLGALPSAAWTLLLAFLGAGLALLNRSLALQIAAGLALVGLVVLVGRSAFDGGLWVPVVPPLLAAVLAGAAVAAALATLERAERREVAALFSRFQGPTVFEEIWRRRDEFMRDGRPVSQKVTLTALMSDLEGYTAASEKMDPQALMAWVDEYMFAMAELVQEYGGVVDDYAGDGIKANFGFPIPSRTEDEIDAQADAAVRCALAMGERMDALNDSWRERGLPTGRCRVGLFTGPAVVGCIGGARSLKYTSVGDTVNTAARLEGFGKDDFLTAEPGVSFRVLIGEETHRRVGARFEIRPLGAHPLKGKDQPVPIFRVLGLREGGAGAYSESSIRA